MGLQFAQQFVFGFWDNEPIEFEQVEENLSSDGGLIAFSSPNNHPTAMTWLANRRSHDWKTQSLRAIFSRWKRGLSIALSSPSPRNQPRSRWTSIPLTTQLTATNSWFSFTASTININTKSARSHVPRTTWLSCRVCFLAAPRWAGCSR